MYFDLLMSFRPKKIPKKEWGNVSAKLCDSGYILVTLDTISCENDPGDKPVTWAEISI